MEQVPLDSFTSAALELELADAAAMPPVDDDGDEDEETQGRRNGDEAMEQPDNIMAELDKAAGLDIEDDQ